MFYSYTGRRHPKIFNVLFYLSNKSLVIPVDTPYCCHWIKRDVWSLKKRKKEEKREKERKKEDKSPNAKEKKDNQIIVLRLGKYVIPKEQM